MKPLCRRRGFTLFELLVVLVIICVLAAMMFPLVNRSRPNAYRANCQSNLKQIGLALMMYSQDYNARLPRIAVNAVSSSSTLAYQPYGWADAIQPYLKTTTLYHCGTEENKSPGATDGVQTDFTDYYFNTNLSGFDTNRLKWPQSTLMVGEGNDGRDGSDARYNRNALPQFWIDNETIGQRQSPAQRHLGSANYLFADGHVKALKPNRVTTSAPQKDVYSFAIR